MRGILIDVNKKIARVMDIEDKLDVYYKLLECDCIDIVPRTICGNVYRIVCDDEGQLVSNPVVSAVDEKGRVELVGNLFIANVNDDGELISLSDDDIKKIMSRVAYACKDDGILLILDMED